MFSNGPLTQQDKTRALNMSLSLLLILWGFSSVQWNSNLIHAGGAHTADQLIKALLHPALNKEILTRAFKAVGITLSYALTGMSLSLLFAFILGLIASGVLFENNRFKLLVKGTRHLLLFMRSIHELVWAWLFVAAFGLHPLSAILALAIPYGGTLGRIFSNMLQDVPKAPTNALSLVGASPLQKLFYVYLPYAIPNMVSYAMYRFECAVRASTVMSFVGLGGLGYEIQLSLNDLEYTEAFTYLYALILLILCIELWSNKLRLSPSLKLHKHWSIQRISIFGAALATALAWLYIHITEGVHLTDLFNEKNLKYTFKFLSGLLGVGDQTPAFLSWQAWHKALVLSLETLQMSILAILFAGLLALFFALPGSKYKMNQNSQGRRGKLNFLLYYLLRGVFIFSRAIPELVWAMMFVFLFKPGPLPGILALGVHNFGILGKLCAEVVENMDQAPLEALKTSGASAPQTLFYGILPLTLPKFITYILYRWEVIIRTSIIVGFVGAGGLGQAFKLSMSWFKYSEITLYLICYLVLIGGVDKFSNMLRKNI